MYHTNVCISAYIYTVNTFLDIRVIIYKAMEFCSKFNLDLLKVLAF